MASTCPNCGTKLHFWNMKADCRKCGVSIPNFNWVGRLEEDNEKAESAFEKFYRTVNRMIYSLVGTKLRIARLVVTFLPAIGFILPWASIKSDATSFDLSLLSFTGGKSAINMLLSFFKNMSVFTTNMSFEKYSGPVTLMTIGLLFYLLSAVFIVIAFLLNIIKCKHPKTKTTFIFDFISIAFSVISVALFMKAGSLGSTAGAINLGDLPFINISGGFAWGYVVALVLFLAATGINMAVSFAPAKSDELLESERVARKEAKEKKEEEAQLKKEAARLEAEKANAEEQAKIVAEAKRKVAEREAKEEAKKAKKE